VDGRTHSGVAGHVDVDCGLDRQRGDLLVRDHPIVDVEALDERGPARGGQADDFDPAVAFMRGKLKSAGPTGPLFDLFRSGEAAAQLSALAARP